MGREREKEKEQKADQLNRRDLFKVGTAVAGTALVQPVAAHFAAGQPKTAASGPDVAMKSDTPFSAVPLLPFPKSLPPAKSKRPNVVLIVLDTERADHCSCYGYHRQTTPNLDAFAAGARVYKNVLAPSCFTMTCHASLFTGLSTSAHGTDWFHWYMDDAFETLAQQLAANGYQTVGLASNSVFVNRRSGFDRGFQTFWNPREYRPPDPTLDVNTNEYWCDDTTRATEMQARLAKWFTDEYDSQKPFFVFMNYLEAHQPYLPPPEFLQFASYQAWCRWRIQMQSPHPLSKLLFDHALTGADMLSSKDIAEVEALYDDAMCYVDRKVGEVLAFLKSTGLEDNTMVIITSDHGEHFGEHRMMDHQFSLYEPLVRTPLVVRYADRFPVGEETSLVQTHDVYPTILELAGVPWKKLPGQTCRSLLQPNSEVRYGISEYLYPSSELHRVCLAYPKANVSAFSRRLRAIQRENMKLICPSEGNPELYDLVNDPMETRNLAKDKADLTREFTATLDAWVRSFDHYVAKPLPRNTPVENPSEDRLKTMRGLGYAH